MSLHDGPTVDLLQSLLNKFHTSKVYQMSGSTDVLWGVNHERTPCHIDHIWKVFHLSEFWCVVPIDMVLSTPWDTLQNRSGTSSVLLPVSLKWLASWVVYFPKGQLIYQSFEMRFELLMLLLMLFFFTKIQKKIWFLIIGFKLLKTENFAKFLIMSNSIRIITF